MSEFPPAPGPDIMSTPDRHLGCDHHAHCETGLRQAVTRPVVLLSSVACVQGIGRAAEPASASTLPQQSLLAIAAITASACHALTTQPSLSWQLTAVTDNFHGRPPPSQQQQQQTSRPPSAHRRASSPRAMPAAKRQQLQPRVHSCSATAAIMVHATADRACRTERVNPLPLLPFV